MDTGAWQTIVHGGHKESDLTVHTHIIDTTGLQSVSL